jgi:hypothetical protein
MDNLTINKTPKNMMCFSSCNAVVHLCHNNNDDDSKLAMHFLKNFISSMWKLT